MNPSSPYRPGREIARGGMGAVLDARDEKLGRSVAMKVMLRRNAGEEEKQRFLQEARVLGQLAHPNIVPIHDLGTDEQGRLFYTMKLVQGVTLQDILRGLKEGAKESLDKFPLNQLLTIFQKVCDAVAFAHSRGIIHRDLKPANIMVGEFGEVLVMDWGLAKILPGSSAAEEAIKSPPLRGELGQTGPTGTLPIEHGDATLPPGAENPDDQVTLSSATLTPADDSVTLLSGTASPADEVTLASGTVAAHALPKTFAVAKEPLTAAPTGSYATMEGAVMGTPNYMSPEQAAGQIKELDARSDIYSLGGILYALLTLRPPVEGESLEEILSNVRSGTVIPPTEFNAPSSAAVATSGAGHRQVVEPKKIFPLRHCPDGKVPSALSAVAMSALQRERERRYQNVAELTADLVAYQGGFATRAEHAGALTLLKLFIRRHKTVAAALGIIAVLTVGFMAQVMSSERKAKSETKRATKAEGVAIQERESARHALAKSALSLAEAGLREADGPAMKAALAVVPEDLRDATWRYLFEQSDTSIARIRTRTQESGGVAAHPRRPGVFAVADRNGQVTLLDVRTGERLLEFAAALPPNASAGPFRLAFSPDGERIAVGRDGGQVAPGRDGSLGIVIHDARDGKKLVEWATPASMRLEFSADGKLILQIEEFWRSFRVWDAATGQLRWAYEPRLRSAEGYFMPGAPQLLTFTGDGLPTYLQLLNAEDGALVRKVTGANLKGNAMAVRPDGKLAVIASREGLVRSVDLTDGRVLSEFRPSSVPIQQVAFTPDGTRFVTVAVLTDGRQAIQVWDADTAAPLQSLLGGIGPVKDLSIHPLSGELLVSGPDGRAWNLAGNPEKWTLKGTNYASFAFGGSDDLVFAADRSRNAPAALHRLRPDSAVLLWRHTNSVYRQPIVSGDARFAALCVPGAVSRPVVLLRNTGSEPEEVRTFQLAYGPDQIRLSYSGDRLVVIESQNRVLELFDTASGTQPVKLDPQDAKRFWDLGWLNRGQRLVGLATAKADRGSPDSEERIVLWDPDSGKVLQTATHRTAMSVLVVAPDGRRFAEAGADKLVRIRDGATLAVQQEFRAHDGPITALAWHPTKPILATASTDLSIKLWNFDTGRLLEELRGPLAPVTMLDFSPSGQRLGCAGPDGVTRIWEPKSLN